MRRSSRNPVSLRTLELGCNVAGGQAEMRYDGTGGGGARPCVPTVHAAGDRLR